MQAEDRTHHPQTNPVLSSPLIRLEPGLHQHAVLLETPHHLTSLGVRQAFRPRHTLPSCRHHRPRQPHITLAPCFPPRGDKHDMTYESKTSRPVSNVTTWPMPATNPEMRWDEHRRFRAHRLSSDHRVNTGWGQPPSLHTSPHPSIVVAAHAEKQ